MSNDNEELGVFSHIPTNLEILGMQELFNKEYEDFTPVDAQPCKKTIENIVLDIVRVNDKG